MKIIIASAALFFILLIAGFAFVAFSDIRPPQKETVKEIPHERFANPS